MREKTIAAWAAGPELAILDKPERFGRPFTCVMHTDSRCGRKPVWLFPVRIPLEPKTGVLKSRFRIESLIDLQFPGEDSRAFVAAHRTDQNRRRIVDRTSYDIQKPVNAIA